MRFIISFCLLLVASGHALAAPNVGAMLYKKNCMACHGASGEGGVGVPLALQSFQAQASDRFLKNTIRFGRVGRVMPAFKSLSDDELNALVTYIRTFTKATPPVYSQEPIRANAEHGKQLFNQNCATCHGDHGQGGKGTGVTFSRPRDLPIIAPALNNEGFLKSASDAMIQATLQQGREGTPMASFLKQGMSQSDINDVVAYIRTFDKDRPADRSIKDEPYYLEVESPHDFEQTVANLKQAVVGENYRLIRTQKFDYGLVKAEQEDAKKVVVYFCNFKLLNEALTVDPRVGLFLPCRLTVVEHKGKVRIMAINPLHLSHFFNNDELTNLCKGMRETYELIMEGATL